jgi:hypothetical protein
MRGDAWKYRAIREMKEKEEMEKKWRENPTITPDYKKGYDILIPYFILIPEEEQMTISKKLKEVGL